MHARLPTAHAPPSCLISIRAATLDEASQFLPVFARVTIDRSLCHLVSVFPFVPHDFRKIKAATVPPNRLHTEPKRTIFVIDFLWSAIGCVARHSSFLPSRGKSVATRGGTIQSSRTIYENERSRSYTNDSLDTRQRISPPQRLVTHSSTSFAGISLLGVSLPITERAPPRSLKIIPSLCPRDVNRNTKGKSLRRLPLIPIDVSYFCFLFLLVFLLFLFITRLNSRISQRPRRRSPPVF